MLLNRDVGEVSWVSWTARRSNQSILKEIRPNIHWKDWFWSWSSNTLAPWHEKLTHLNRLWCWEKLKAGGEGDDRGWDSWMASLTDGHEFEQALGVCDEQGSLVCCSSGGLKESDTTEWLNWTVGRIEGKINFFQKSYVSVLIFSFVKLSHNALLHLGSNSHRRSIVLVFSSAVWFL